MLDREGFRPNVGIILLNANNEVWWGKRVREHSWQFPQGGIKYGETPEQAMYRELQEEIGLKPEHVKIVGRTRDWLRYEVPDHFIKREIRGHYRGQKQIWFLLRLIARDNEVNLRLTDHPEFDAWRWHTYWVPLDVVIEFKRDVYQRALQELSRFLTWPGQGERRQSSRYLRQPHVPRNPQGEGERQLERGPRNVQGPRAPAGVRAPSGKQVQPGKQGPLSQTAAAGKPGASPKPGAIVTASASTLTSPTQLAKAAVAAPQLILTPDKTG